MSRIVFERLVLSSGLRSYLILGGKRQDDVNQSSAVLGGQEKHSWRSRSAPKFARSLNEMRSRLPLGIYLWLLLAGLCATGCQSGKPIKTLVLNGFDYSISAGSDEMIGVGPNQRFLFMVDRDEEETFQVKAANTIETFRVGDEPQLLNSTETVLFFCGNRENLYLVDDTDFYGSGDQPRAEIVADMEKTSFQPIPESTILDWGEAIYEPAFQVGGGRQYRLVRLPRKVTADQARKEIRDKLMGWREKGRQGEK